MAQFIHLADAKHIPRIERNGILARSTRLGQKGFYCTPVVLDYFRTHQWLRELKRSGVKTIQAVQFDLVPETLVWIGKYNGDFLEVTAAEASLIFNEHDDGLGLEVIVPHSVSRTSITRIYSPSQVLGWRIHPKAKGSKPFCGCRYCNRGEINAYRVITEERPSRSSRRNAKSEEPGE
ncbi:hypothetical protein ACFPT7_09895 [Acidicapsa dinghuensis]|uniref:DUF4433 domain-containing protein n=1 Tax=Acidicapsa dinghuensis TaxID=2218256 RepID=A0ABW1EH84_9BACT|nr:hypothetical protein [Acidicapsa dinghuensis]